MPLPSSYRDVVAKEQFLTDAWPMNALSGSEVGLGGRTLAFGGGVAQGQEGYVPRLGHAGEFDGVNDYASVALDLSGFSTITIEFWMRTSYDNNDSLAMEFTANANTQAGSFYLNPDASTASNQNFHMAIGNAAGAQPLAQFARAAPGWHHYVIVLLRGQTGPANAFRAYVDGVAQTITSVLAIDGASTGNFANSTLYVGSRAGTALFAPMVMQWLAIYGGVELTAKTALAHYVAGARPLLLGAAGASLRPAIFTPGRPR